MRLPSLLRNILGSQRPARRRARQRARLGVEQLERRLLPVATIFTLTITRFQEIDDPDPGPDDGDYYPFVRINGVEQDRKGNVETGEDVSSPAWTFTQSVESTQGQVPVFIAMYDEDGFLRFDDDEMDINPGSGLLGINLSVDLATGRWTGDVPFPGNSSQGGGDDDSDRGRVFFEIDSDSDGLNNRWEIQGIDGDGDGVPDFLLPIVGANPARKDLFVEVDSMMDATGNRAPLPLPPIIDATPTTPIVITSNNHGLTTGTRVTIADVGGTTGANGTFLVTRLDNNTFRLEGSMGGGAYTPKTGKWSLADLAGTGLATNTSLDLAIDAFRKAPVTNPDGSSGINLHVQIDETVPVVAWTGDFDNDGLDALGEDRNANGLLDPGEDTINVNFALDNGDADDQGDGQAFMNFVQGFRQSQFGSPVQRILPAGLAAKALAYRYCVFADRRAEARSNNMGADVSSSGRAISAGYFLVTLGNINGGTPDVQAATFMHEFGHTLTLQHGGGDSINNKPNYFSTMNYTWQLPEQLNVNMQQSWRLDFSTGNVPDLNEGGLNEGAGIGGRPGLFVRVGPAPAPAPGGPATQGPVVPQTGAVNWNQTGPNNEPNVPADINRINSTDPASPGQTLRDFNDWGSIVYGIAAAQPRFAAIFGSGQEVEFTLESWMDVSQTLFYLAPTGNGPDALTLRRSGDQIELVNDATGAVVAQRSAAATAAVVVCGAHGEDDRLTVNFTSGNPIPAQGVRFDGGGGVTDRLAFAGPLPATPVYTPNAGGLSENGTLNLGGSLITFTGLEFVNAVPPDVTGVRLNTPVIDEGGTVTLTGEFVDPGVLASHSVTVNWGDGAADAPVSLAVGTRSFTFTHKYRDDDPTGTPFDISTVSVTVTDNDGLSDTATTTVRVNNVAPLLQNVAITAEIDENGTVTLSGGILDPGVLDTFTLLVDWGEGPAQTFSYGVGTTSFAETHQYLDDNPTATPQDVYAVGLTLIDDDTGQAVAGASTLVKNVAPVFTALTGSATSDEPGKEGEPMTLTGSFTDVGTLDTHTVTVDWGDGTVTSSAVTEAGGAGSFTDQHTFQSGGIIPVVITLRDDDTGEVQRTKTVFITGVGVRLFDGKLTLQVVGSKLGDRVHINEQGNGVFQVHADFLAEGKRDIPVAGIELIQAALLGGDDQMTIAGSVSLPSVLDGGKGNDQLNGGGGNNVLIGGDGIDQLLAGSARDILIGSRGADRLVGNGGDDILIGGGTAYDSGADDDKLANDAILLKLMAEWNSSRSYAERLANLRDGTGPILGGTGRQLREGVTVFDDLEVDELTGSSGVDWFFLGVGDRANDQKSGEAAD